MPARVQERSLGWRPIWPSTVVARGGQDLSLGPGKEAKEASGNPCKGGHDREGPGGPISPSWRKGAREPWWGVSEEDTQRLGTPQWTVGPGQPGPDVPVGSPCFLSRSLRTRAAKAVPSVRDGLEPGGNRRPPSWACFSFGATINCLEQPPHPPPRLLFCSRGVSVMIRHYLKQW